MSYLVEVSFDGRVWSARGQPFTVLQEAMTVYGQELRHYPAARVIQVLAGCAAEQPPETAPAA